MLSFALQIAEETDGALKPTIYPVLTAWGFTTEENRVPFDAEITELLKNVGYERIRQEDTTVQLESGMRCSLWPLSINWYGFTEAADQEQVSYIRNESPLNCRRQTNPCGGSTATL